MTARPRKPASRHGGGFYSLRALGDKKTLGANARGRKGRLARQPHRFPTAVQRASGASVTRLAVCHTTAINYSQSSRGIGHMRSTARARAAGVRAATAPVVALAEDHAFPAPGWAEAFIERHGEGWAAVGPVISNANPRSATSWANLLIEYAPWLEGARGGARGRRLPARRLLLPQAAPRFPLPRARGRLARAAGAAPVGAVSLRGGVFLRTLSARRPEPPRGAGPPASPSNKQKSRPWPSLTG